jgi:hypothetical protein
MVFALCHQAEFCLRYEARWSLSSRIVAGAGDKAELRLVALGPADGELASIVKGLSPDDRIIVGNLQKIGPGSRAAPNYSFPKGDGRGSRI